MAILKKKVQELAPTKSEVLEINKEKEIRESAKPEIHGSQSKEVGELAEQTDDTSQDWVSDGEDEVATRTSTVVPASAYTQKDDFDKKIEDVLAQDLTDTFLSLPENKQALFKQKGEETAGKIRLLLDKTKVQTAKIFKLISDWLKLIPGINRFFILQEAKIKTDRIVHLHEQTKKNQNDTL
jgi:hypothetical protein